MLLALTPKQALLKNVIEKTNKENIGFGGARGGAKSHGIRDLALFFGYKYNIQILIFRKYRDDLLKNHVYPMLKLYPHLRPYFNKSEMILYNRNRNPMIKFDYAESYEEIEKVGQGTEYQITFIDEATQSTQEMIEYLGTCTRDSHNLFPTCAKVVLTMNPGGVGHSYVKRTFVDKVYSQNEDPNSYYFIQAHVWDNVFWSLKSLYEKGYTINDYYYKWTEEQRKNFTIEYSSYAKRLSNLPEQLKLAYLYGDWNVFGGMFFRGLNLNTQIVDPFEVSADWFVAASMDPGFASPLSFGLQTKSPNGKVFKIGTYYGVDNIRNHPKNIKSWLKSENSPIYRCTRGRLPDVIVSGADAFQKLDKNSLQSNEDTVEQYFQEENLYLLRANTKPGSRIAGWWKWKSLIPDRFFIFRDLNKPLIEQMTAVESDPKFVEDILGKGNDPKVEDHCLDETRYGVDVLISSEDYQASPLPDWYEKEMDDDTENYSSMGV